MKTETKKLPNCIINHGACFEYKGVTYSGAMLKCFGDNIAFYPYEVENGKDKLKMKPFLDVIYWDKSHDVRRFRECFLGETTDETISKIRSDDYTIANLIIYGDR